MKNGTEIFCLHQGYLQMSAERFIKTIAELRRKICMTKQSLEQEIERKRCAEKNLTELRREVSKQKKMMSMRRCVPLPAITSVKKCVKWIINTHNQKYQIYYYRNRVQLQIYRALHSFVCLYSQCKIGWIRIVLAALETLSLKFNAI